MANALENMTLEEKIASFLGGSGVVEGMRANTERKLLEAELAKAKRQELGRGNVLRQAARESYTPGSPATAGQMSAADTAAPFAGTPGAQQYSAPGMSNALAGAAFALPEESTPGKPATPGSFDRSGFERKAVERGVDIKEIHSYMADMDEAEVKALKKQTKELENIASYVLFGGSEQELMPRFNASLKALSYSGVDVSSLQNLKTPQEVGAAVSRFMDQAKAIDMYKTKEVSKRIINRAGQRTSTAGIVTEKDAWNAVKAERARILRERAQSWNPDEIDVDALMEEFVATEIPEKFRPYIRKMRGMESGGGGAPIKKDKGKGFYIRYDSKGNRIQ